MRRKSEDGPPRLAWDMYKRFLLAGAIITCLCAATIASAVLLEVKEGLDIFRRNTTPIDPQVKALLADVAPGKPQTILVIGDDRRKAEALQKHPPPTRSDTMILVRLDPHQRATALMSIPRDLMVDIPGHGRQKLNAAFAFGEDRLTLRTVRNLLGNPDPPLSSASPSGASAARSTGWAASTSTSTTVLQRQQPAQRRRRALRGHQRPRGLPEAVRRGRARATSATATCDNDLVRAARQQSFLGEAKNQIGVNSVFSDRKELLRIFGQSIPHRHRLERGHPRAPAGSSSESAEKPIQEVQFPAEDAGDGSGNVVIGPTALKRTSRASWPPARPPARAARRQATTSKAQQAQSPAPGPSAVAGLIRNRNASENIAAPLQVKLGRLPVYYPTLMSATGSYRVDDSRAYDIVDGANKRHRAYRIVAYDGRIGQYYGVQGTDWRSPPILDSPSASVTLGRAQVQLFYDGSRLKLVAWRTRRGSYWVSNTLLRTLTNKQMLALARSARTLGGR